MTQYLFSAANLDRYRNNGDIIRSLNGVELLNLEEFKAVFDIPLRRSGRSASSAAAAADEATELSLSAAITLLTQNVCKNMINELYLGQSFRNAYNLSGFSKSLPPEEEVKAEVAELGLPELSNEQQQRNDAMLEVSETQSQSQSEEESQMNEQYQLERNQARKLERVTEEIEEEAGGDKPITFDLLIAFAPGFRETIADANTRGIKPRVEALLEKVVGFIIVQLGECETHPYAYAVNLICTRTLDDDERTSIKGALLMGAYLFCIKQLAGVEQVGILELADGYKNFAGFSAYTKMMFDKNISLSVEGCFYDNTNLAMSADLLGLSEAEIIGLAVGTLRRPTGSIRDDTGMYGLVPEKGNAEQIKLQVAMAVYANLMYKFQVADFQFRNGDEKFMNQLLEAPWSILPKNQLEIVNVLYSRYSKVLSPSLFPFLIGKLQSYIQTLILTFRRMRNPLGIQTRSDALARKNDMNVFETPAGVASRSDVVPDAPIHVLRSTAAAEEQIRQEEVRKDENQSTKRQKPSEGGKKTKRRKIIKKPKTVKRRKIVKRKKSKTMKRRKTKRTSKSKKNKK
uniref:Uncharacterized protein n=1 Tax=viral metagenome TaxID=1070528 RepID=A0A6C0LCB2_9ZZZZ